MKNFVSKRWLSLGMVLVGVFYLLTHVFNLVALPVFADESIYIRWTQLIMDEPKRYAMFALNDGKTPLFIWLMLPFQYLFSDQLFSGRLVAVLVGLAQVFVMGWLVQLMGGRKKTQYLAMVLTSVLPFWFFHHRMALMDGMMTLWLSIALGGAIKVAKAKDNKEAWWSVDLVGLGFGLAMLTKIPAILFFPVLGLVGFLPEKATLKSWFNASFKIGVGVLIGLVMFLALKLSPAFGQLFSRGGDFLFPLSDILAGAWKQTIISFPNYFKYFVYYLTLPGMVLVLVSLFSPVKKRVHHWLFWSGLIFLLPIMIMGKVVYPRYLMAGSIFFTLSMSLAFEHFYTYSLRQKNNFKKVLIQLLLVLLLGNMVAASGVNMAMSWFNPNKTTLVSADKVQYLHEWSSGHGIKETYELITNMAKTEKIAVATEGYFGTLPDALLMYFHGKDVTNLYLEGIGQPVSVIPNSFLERAKNFDRVLLVVNSHRQKLPNTVNKNLLLEVCRPDSAPCLQVWELLD